MDSRLLECYLRVAELGSINRAAADLGLSQPALSRHIAALEHEMKAQLFTRSQGGVRLTDAGKLLADRARPLLRQFAVLKEQVGERAAGQLSIGIPPSWHHVFTLAFVDTLLREYPGIMLRMYEGVSNLLREHLLAGLLDLCIVPFDQTPPSGYRQTALLREPLVLVGHAQTSLAPDEPVPITQLNDLQLVLPARPNVLRTQIENALNRKSMTFRTIVETDTLRLCLELASRRFGHTVVPACALHGHGLGKAIQWAPVKGMYLTWALYENEARSHSQAALEGRRLLLSTLAASLEPGTWYGAEAIGTSLDR